MWDQVICDGIYKLEMPDELVIRAINMFQREGPKKILDIGCGLGRHIQMFVERGHTVLGMDIAESAIKKSHIKVALYPKAYLALGDVTQLALRSDNFCLALAWRMLHLNTEEQIEKALKEINRILRPNGIVVCSVRSTTNTLYYKSRENGTEIEPNTYKILNGPLEGLVYHFFTKDEVQKRFSRYFKIISLEEQELEHTSYTVDDKTSRNRFWVIIGRKKEGNDR